MTLHAHDTIFVRVECTNKGCDVARERYAIITLITSSSQTQPGAVVVQLPHRGPPRRPTTATLRRQHADGAFLRALSLGIVRCEGPQPPTPWRTAVPQLPSQLRWSPSPARRLRQACPPPASRTSSTSSFSCKVGSTAPMLPYLHLDASLWAALACCVLEILGRIDG